MFKSLLKVSSAPPGQRAAEGNNTAVRQPAGSPRWSAVALIFMGLGLIGSCGGPSQQALTTQALSQMQAPNPNKDLQNQLMLQANQASLVSYKDYKVGAEDQLVIEVYGQEKLKRELRVNGQGEIAMPLVGVVKVAGLTPQEIEKRLTELYDARFLVNPQVSVEVKEFRHQRVSITGAVAKPGSYEIIGPRTLLEVLALAGGFSSSSSSPAGDVVNIIRHQNAPDLTKTMKGEGGTAKPFIPQAETMVIDLRRLVSGQAPDLNITVQNGDVVHVPFAGTAYVLGAVKKPGHIAVRENLTLIQAIALAGDVDPILGTDNITIMRFDEQGKPISINANLKRIIARTEPDIPVKDNDVVVVNESSVKKALYIIRALFPIPTPPVPAL